jgi:hypothetical protein
MRFLLLCGHHYLASQAALAVVGAVVIDENDWQSSVANVGEHRNGWHQNLGPTPGHIDARGDSSSLREDGSDRALNARYSGISESD